MLVLSLFDGISCGQVALQRAGIKVDHYFASEVDKYAIQITQKNFPNTYQLGDVTKIDWTPFIGKVDLLIGGSPCIDLSIAKQNRKGLDGPYSSLFFKFLEALKTIKPKWFLFENVASMSEENKKLISSYLGAEPVMINSALVSAQNRKRLYWTNIPDVTQPEDKGIVVNDILEDGFISVNNSKSNCLTSTAQRTSLRDFFEKSRFALATKPVRIGTLPNLGKGQANRIYSVQGKSVCLNANGGGSGAKTGLYKVDLPDGDYIIRKLTPTECERLQTLPDGYTIGVSDAQRYKCLGNGWTVDVIAHILKGLKNVEENKTN
jgi:DNA (cytosine-5)-methyltransferase 3A